MSKLRGWLSAAHPFPLAMVLLLTTLIAFATAGGEPDSKRLIFVLTAMLSSQLSIGWSNDYLDRDADARYQPSKPLPSGLVNAELMPGAIALALVVSAIAGAFLGLLPLLLLGAGTLCGLSYNLGVKATLFSALPFVVAFAVLPLYVWTALDVFSSDLLALYPIGLSLPVAVHLANVLPDVETDAAQGRMTIVVRLGRKWSIGVLLACLVLPLVLTLLSLIWLDYDGVVMAISLGLYIALSLVAAHLSLGSNRSGAVWAFRLVVLASIVFAGGWLSAI